MHSEYTGLEEQIVQLVQSISAASDPSPAPKVEGATAVDPLSLQEDYTLENKVTTLTIQHGAKQRDEPQPTLICVTNLTLQSMQVRRLSAATKRVRGRNVKPMYIHCCTTLDRI